MNNNIAFVSLLVVFLFIGFITPFVESEFGVETGQVDTSKIIDNVEADEVGVTDIFFSVFKVFFWTFGSIPVAIDLLIMTPMRVWFATLVVDKVRGIGS